MEPYQVTNKTKELWLVELDLLEKLKSICNKYNLKCFATAGTLLGAARHKGFIPWDDDIDVALMWSDYKRLLEIAPGECEYPYFFQSYLTEKDGETNGSRLRRSDTTGFTLWENNNVGPEYNRGIFIDVFPLFYIPDDLTVRSQQKEQVLYYWKCIRGHDALRQLNSGKKVNKDYEAYIEDYLRLSKTLTIEEIKTKYLNACAMINIPQKEIGATASRVHQENMMWDAAWFEPYVELPFENTTICCPNCYEKVLEKQYGDWRTPVYNGSMHEMYVVDPETPYKDYIMNNNTKA